MGVTLAVQRPPGNHLLLGKNSLVTIFRQDDKILPVIIVVASILLQLYLNGSDGFVDKHYALTPRSVTNVKNDRRRKQWFLKKVKVGLT